MILEGLEISTLIVKKDFTLLITTILNEACPFCNVSGQYGNISVSSNTLNRGCNNCKQWDYYPLPPLKKKIIYLDQFFISHAFRQQEKPFVDAAERIKDMAARQLVVCPYSSVHVKETHLWRHENQQSLFEFIKQTARGHKYSQHYEISKVQIQHSFELFKNGKGSEAVIDLDQAFHNDVHTWDDYFWIDIAPHLGDLDAMRQGKADAIATLIGLFPAWSNLKTTFSEDVAFEALGYGRSLLQQYKEMLKAAESGDFMAKLNAPIEASYIETLLYYDSKTLSHEDRFKRIAAFISSKHFTKIPFVNVSCGLFAVLRKMVKNGAYTNPVNAKRKLAGLFYDSECISVFGPYSDAIFIDRAMEQWCKEPEANLLDRYDTKVFSAHTWDDFHNYLDEIEGDMSEELKNALPLAYPQRM